MTIIPANGKNERMGSFFKTPKQFLLKNGKPAILRTVEYMQNFGLYVILCNPFDEEALSDFNRIVCPPTDNVIDTIKYGIPGNYNSDLWIVDCDVIPIRLTKPKENTVFCFENRKRHLHYSNFEVKDGRILSCNEKQSVTQWAGAGVYYFRSVKEFLKYSNYCKSVSEVYKKMLANNIKVYADTDNDIFRFGTLKDINDL